MLSLHFRILKIDALLWATSETDIFSFTPSLQFLHWTGTVRLCILIPTC